LSSVGISNCRPSAGDAFCKRCNCRKHFRWSQGGKQYRKQAGARTWAEAEENKRRLEARLSGQPVAEDLKTVEDAVKVFNADQVNEGWTAGVLGKYTRELARLQGHCEGQEVFTVQGITRELLVGYQATWPELYPSTQTRQAVQARLRKLLRFCYDNRWLDRVPRTARIKVDEAPTLPLTTKEYEHLLKTCTVSFPDAQKAAKVHGLIQTMEVASGISSRFKTTPGRHVRQCYRTRSMIGIELSLGRNPQKNDRVKMPYKRLSPLC
jgi:integrase/recombinase XerD